MPQFIILCGKTGCGKTLILQKLALHNYPVIDIEKIANHRGSAFGNVCLPLPPSQHDFENELYRQLQAHQYCNYVFIENKPAAIGKLRLPDWFLQNINNGLSIQLEVVKDDRIANLIALYVPAGKVALNAALQKLNKRIAAEELSLIQQYLDAGNYPLFIGGLLNYYDQSVLYHYQKNPLATIKIIPFNAEKAALEIIETLKQKNYNF